MAAAQTRRAHADDAVLRAEMANTELQQARDRLTAHQLDLEHRRAVSRERRAEPAPSRRRPG